MPKDGSRKEKNGRVDGSGDEKSQTSFLWKKHLAKNISWITGDLEGLGERGSKQLVGLIAFARGEQEHVLQVVDTGVVEEHVGKHLEGDAKQVIFLSPLETQSRIFILMAWFPQRGD